MMDLLPSLTKERGCFVYIIHLFKKLMNLMVKYIFQLINNISGLEN